MAIRRYLARDFKFDISSNNGVTYAEISGISTWSFTVDSNEEDVSTFDNGAWGSTFYTQRTGSLSLEGFYLINTITGARDPGQLAVEVAATKVGFDAQRTFRVRAVTASGEIGNFFFSGQAALGDMGGSTTDVMPWGADLIFDGRPTGSGSFNIF